jgi:flagellar biosynthesis protein FlhG
VLARGARGRILGIASGKGGVGKSALAVNLAVAAAGTGASTLLIDGDLGLANADLLMGLVPAWDLGDVAEGRCAFEAALSAGPAGLELLVVGGRPSAVAALERGLGGAPGDALAARIDGRGLTLLDLGAGIGAGVIELARHCDPVWLVATPEPTSLADAYTTAKHLWERAPGLPLELVVNRAVDRASGERTHRALDRLTRRFLDRPLPLRAILPDDPAMGLAVARQLPVLLDAPQTPIARRIRLLAESIVEERRALRPRDAESFAPGSAR